MTANIKKRQKDEKQKKKDEDENKKDQEQNGRRGEGDKKKDEGQEDNNDEHDWRRGAGKDGHKHHDAYGKGGQSNDEAQVNGEQKGQKTDYQKLREKYSPEEITLLRALQHERDQTKAFEQNDGRLESPVKEAAEHRPVEIQAVDAMTPDNW